MNRIQLILGIFFLTGSSLAQSVYESPHVTEGKTFQLDVPAFLFETLADEESYIPSVQMYTTGSSKDMYEIDFEAPESGVLMLVHESPDVETLASLKKTFDDEIKTNALTVIEKPTITTVNGREFMFAGMKGNISENLNASAAYVAATVFGDYTIIMTFISTEKSPSFTSYATFRKMAETFRVVATEKEDGMDGDMSEYFESLESMDFETNYKNELFDTELNYFHFLPDYMDTWDEPYEENPRLLTEFTFNGNQGAVRIFSGGKADKYHSKAELEIAISAVFDLDPGIIIAPVGSFEGEEHLYAEYSVVSGGNKIVRIYTTRIPEIEELVFFVVESGVNTPADYKKSYSSFMQAMWVDYEPEYIEEEEVEEPEEE